MSSPPPPTDGGVGGLVLEPSSRLRSTKKDADAVSESEAKYSEDEVEMKTTAHAGKKRSAPSKRKKKEEEEEEEEEDEGSEGHPSKKAKKTHRGTKITTDSDTPPVDLSSSVAALRARHDEYMELTSAKLNDILNVNLISAPKEKAKDKLAWSCVYGEIFGAPVGKCPRCLHGKLKPKLKPEQWGHKFKKGEIKWACPGYFDAETDSLKFCNKTYSMDGSEIATRKFRGLGNITEEDFKEMEDRKALERQERDILHAEHEKNPPHSLGLGHHSHPGDDRPEMVIHAGFAPRLGSEEYFPDFISDPHSTASSASPSAPHVRKSPAPDLEDVKKEHELEKKAPHLHTGHLPKEEKEKATPETAGEQVSEKGKSKNSESLSSKNRKSPIPSMSSSSSTSLPACRYGSDCFRKNPDHFLEYSHPTKEDQPHQEKK